MGDSEYPGTADERLETCKNRAKSLTANELSQDWEAIVRPKLLWAAGLRDLTNVAPGKGNTGHCFNDFNHVDATTMLMQTADNEHDGSVRGIAVGNQLGEGIRAASLPDAGPGGTWCTCSLGANQEPPHDVAHVQFQSKIAWKLVWVPGELGDFSRFVLVDDAGTSLTTGVPTGNVPNIMEREHNFQMLRGGRYAECAKDYESNSDDFGVDPGFSAR